MRRAFFGGAISLLAIMNGGLDHTKDLDEVTDVDMQVMAWITEEFDAYAKAVSEGRA